MAVNGFSSVCSFLIVERFFISLIDPSNWFIKSTINVNMRIFLAARPSFGETEMI